MFVKCKHNGNARTKLCYAYSSLICEVRYLCAEVVGGHICICLLLTIFCTQLLSILLLFLCTGAIQGIIFYVKLEITPTSYLHYITLYNVHWGVA